MVEAEFSFTYKLAVGLGDGLIELCNKMILKPEDQGYSEILSLLYDLSSRIIVPPELGQLLGITGAGTLKDIIDDIAENDKNLAGQFLAILPLVINNLLGKEKLISSYSQTYNICLQNLPPFRP